jgi:hypothetical protein
MAGLHSWAGGAVFKHVTLKGRISAALLNSYVEIPPDEKQVEWDEANAAYYANCDWAFDIREAKFTSSFEFRSVPGRLIRRDPETQILVTRERVQNGAWRSLEIGSYGFGISDLLESNLESTVFAAPRANKKFKEELAYLELLRDAGFAEPD